MDLRTFDIQTLKNLANPSTGLVPMRVKIGFAPNAKGSIAGFPPREALNHLTTGHCELLDEGVQRKVMGEIAAAGPVKPPFVTSKSITEEREEKPELVEIPDDWKTLHGMKRIALAKQIAGDINPPEGKKPGEYADEIIEAEVTRRAATKA